MKSKPLGTQPVSDLAPCILPSSGDPGRPGLLSEVSGWALRFGVMSILRQRSLKWNLRTSHAVRFFEYANRPVALKKLA